MRPYQMYQQVKITTADPLQIVVLLYEGAIKNLNQWLMLIDSDMELATAKLVRTQEIINYLRTALDHEQGGEIAFNLERLYNYMRDRLSEANLDRSKAKVQEVIGLMQTLLEGWHGISNRPAPVSDMNPTAEPVSAVG
ncbi:flagellar export chaperone FliS [bacterium]|nr:flagellar export chaperone FliS [bacterium]